MDNLFLQHIIRKKNLFFLFAPIVTIRLLVVIARSLFSSSASSGLSIVLYLDS